MQQPAARLEVKNVRRVREAKSRPPPVTSWSANTASPTRRRKRSGPALLAYAQLAREFGVEQILVPKSSLRQGLLQETGQRAGCGRKAFTEQVVHSAIALGAKYAFDERHGRQAANLCLQFFQASCSRNTC
jgi:exopolyphosphatase/pppGpp-phosphohydrolase